MHAPEAADRDLATAPPPHFFAVSVPKLAIMSLATAGLYELYWFYRHWARIRERSGETLSAPLRALFHIFFAYPLFRRINADLPDAAAHVSPLLLAIVFVAVGVASVLPLPEPWTFVGLLAILPLLEVQSQANAVNRTRSPAAATNRGFSRVNVLGLTVCAALWTVGIAGLVQARRDPGSALNLEAAAVEARRALPRTVADGIKLIEVNAAVRKLSYVYLVADETAPRFRQHDYRQLASRELRDRACSETGSRRLLDASVTLEHTYRGRANETLLTHEITRANCATNPAESIAARLIPLS